MHYSAEKVIESLDNTNMEMSVLNVQTKYEGTKLFFNLGMIPLGKYSYFNDTILKVNDTTLKVLYRSAQSAVHGRRAPPRDQPILSSLFPQQAGGPR